LARPVFIYFIFFTAYTMTSFEAFLIFWLFSNWCDTKWWDYRREQQYKRKMLKMKMTVHGSRT